jgi:hypothetical protein
MKYYWHIETWDKEIIKVKPDPQADIDYIQQLISKGEGAVLTPTRSISVKNIKDFRLSDEPYVNQKLLETNNALLGRPTYTKEGSVIARWVKKQVPARRWQSFYSANPAYHLLSSDNSLVTMAFLLPIHLIDHSKVEELSDDEEYKLSKKPT